MSRQSTVLAALGSRLIALIVLSMACVGLAQHSNEELDAAAVFERYIDATGGRSAWSHIVNRVVHSTMSMPAHDLEIEMTVTTARPNLRRSVLLSEMTGRIEKGSDGQIVWQTDPSGHSEIKTGDARDNYLRESVVNKYLDWRKSFKQIALEGSGQVDGVAAWIVRAEPPRGPTQRLFFAKKSGLLIQLAVSSLSPSGELSAKAIFSDYRDAGGVLMPFQVTITLPGSERLVTVQSVETNITLPEGFFAPPPELRAQPVRGN